MVPAEDPDALARAMLDLSANKAVCRKMGGRNRIRAVAEHGWNASARQLVRLYEELLLK